jgi:hypothetical protein
MADDPTFGRADSVYGSMRDKIIARVNHASPQYHADIAKVFELLFDAISDHKQACENLD